METIKLKRLRKVKSIYDNNTMSNNVRKFANDK